jgi:hypothetical protein
MSMMERLIHVEPYKRREVKVVQTYRSLSADLSLLAACGGQSSRKSRAVTPQHPYDLYKWRGECGCYRVEVLQLLPGLFRLACHLFDNFMP